MGIGHFVQPQIAGEPVELDLIVSFQFDASGVMDDWRNTLEWGSTLLALATGDKFRLGRIVWANDQSANAIADIWIHNDDTSSSADPGEYSLGTEGAKIHLGIEALGTPGNKGKPGQLVHELGHYAFDLREENELGARCMSVAKANTDGACVMQYASKGLNRNDDGSAQWPHPGVLAPLTRPITQFCHPDNHESANEGSTPQTVEHPSMTSCWETIVLDTAYHPAWPAEAAIAVPGTAPVPPPPPDPMDLTAGVPAQLPITWLEIDTIGRFALVLDNSASMQAQKAIDGVEFGGCFWIDLEVLLGNRLAIVTFATDATVFHPLDHVDAADADSLCANLKSALDATGASTNIRAGLTAGDAQVGPGPAAKRTMIQFSDGRHNEGTDLDDTEIENIGAVVHTIGSGNADQMLMHKIADKNNGSWRYIHEPGDQPDAHHHIASELTSIAAATHSGLIAFRQAILLPSRRLRPDIERSRVRGRDLQQRQTGPGPSEGVDLIAPVEAGAQRAVFVLNHRVESPAELMLFRPGEQRPADASDPDVRIVVRHESAYSMIVVDQPTEGPWLMRAVRLTAGGYLPLTLQAFSENPDIAIGVIGANELHDADQEIRLAAQVTNRFQLTGIYARLGRERRPETSILCRWLARLGLWRWLQGPRLARWLAGLRLVRLLLAILRGHPGGGQWELDEEREGRGWYAVKLPGFPEPGSYDVIATLDSDGTASQALDPQHAAEAGVPLPAPFVAPAFRRLMRFQLHVGPLPRGDDTD